MRVKGNDLYEQSNFIRITFIVVWIVWILLFLASSVLVLNAKFRVDICEPAAGPCTGEVYTDQWSSIGWIATCLFGTNVFFIAAYQFLLAFGRNRACSIIWIVIMLLAWLAGFIGWVLLLSEKTNCNKPGYPSNICTSLEACLVPEFFNDAIGNRCPNSPFGTRAYTLQLSNLEPRLDFMWFLWATVAFSFVLNPLLLFMVVVIWTGIR